MINKLRILITRHAVVLASLPLLAAAGIQDAAAYTVPPGLGTEPGNPPPAGYPGFYNVSSVKFEKLSSGAFKLTGTGTGGYEFDASPTTPGWSLSSGSFKLTANFTSGLAFNPTGSNVEIKGKIPTYTGSGVINHGGLYGPGQNVKNTVKTLYKADLLNMGLDLSPLAFGFTTDASDDIGWATQFMTNNESVWFYNQNNTWAQILNAIDVNKNRRTWSVTYANLGTITTVPVPAAVWLLGSGLVALFGMRRKNLSAVNATMPA